MNKNTPRMFAVVTPHGEIVYGETTHNKAKKLITPAMGDHVAATTISVPLDAAQRYKERNAYMIADFTLTTCAIETPNGLVYREGDQILYCSGPAAASAEVFPNRDAAQKVAKNIPGARIVPMAPIT